jgi:hypothetical protein
MRIWAFIVADAFDPCPVAQGRLAETAAWSSHDVAFLTKITENKNAGQG